MPLPFEQTNNYPLVVDSCKINGISLDHLVCVHFLIKGYPTEIGWPIMIGKNWIELKWRLLQSLFSAFKLVMAKIHSYVYLILPDLTRHNWKIRKW